MTAGACRAHHLICQFAGAGIRAQSRKASKTCSARPVAGQLARPAKRSSATRLALIAVSG
jgi:hypothetical protein